MYENDMKKNSIFLFVHFVQIIFVIQFFWNPQVPKTLKFIDR
jgi:hypothetical protein